MTKPHRRCSFRVTPLLTALWIVLGSSSIAAQAPERSPEEQALADRFEQLNAAFADGDTEATLAFYAEGFVRLPPGEPAVFEHDAFREQLETSLANYDYSLDAFRIRRVEVSGDMGHTVATYTDSVTPKAGGDTETQSGRWALLWRQEDGVWKISFEIWNMDPPN
jgi:ketosteroid isomerase-like protein